MKKFFTHTFLISLITTNLYSIDLIKDTWKLTEFNKQIINSDSEQPFISFNNGKITGFLGCNDFFGSYELNNNKIKINPVARTLKMCANITLEDRLNKSFQFMNYYKIESNILKIYDNNHNEIAIFKRENKNLDVSF